MRKTIRRVLFGIALVSIVVILHSSGLIQVFTFEQLKQHSSYLQAYVARYYWLSIFGFFAIYTTSVATSMPAAFLFAIAGGFLFGTFLGAVLSIIASTLGAILAFWSVRYLIGDFIQQQYRHYLINFNRAFAHYGTQFLIFIHFIAVVPLFLVNVLAGLTNISTWTFCWTTFLGVVPGIIIFSFAGSQLQQFNSMQDIFSFKIIIAFALMGLLACIPLILQFVGISLFKK